MTEGENALEIAAIKADGSLRGPDDYGIDMFRVDTPQGPFWFEAYFNFAPNGCDFTVVIKNFGLWRKSAAGSTTPNVRKKFSASEARSAESHLKAFFLGPKDNPGLPYLLRLPKANCIGVDFPKGWISIV
jgi:hypothetical protein